MKFINFKKMPPEKRNHLILVVLGTIAALVGLGYGLIKYQYANLADLARRKADTESKLEKMQNMVKHAEAMETDLAKSMAELSEQEKGMASRDVYSWFITTMRRFKQSYNVEIPQVGQPNIGDVNLLAKFPYKQATLSVSGTAHFYDLGRFMADFENQFPHMRVVNLQIDPSPGPEEAGMLDFKMEIITLVNSNPS